MNETIKDNYELDFTAKGAANVERQVLRLQDTLDGLARSGDLSQSGLRKTTQATERLRSTLSSSTSAVKRYSDSFSQLRKEASAAETAIQRAAQNYVGRGGTNPLGYSANNLSLADAQKFDAVNRASNLSLQQAASERLRLEDRLNTAKREGVAADRELANVGRSRTAVARENLSIAQQELQLARQQVAGLGASGGRRGGAPATISDQVAAQERLTSATKNVSVAQRELNAVTDQGTQSSAALRYANYDLASTLLITAGAITGLGAVTASTFADIESGFSAVERTSGLYGEELTPLRDQLLELSRVLPVTTQELQSFATRGAQLGIAQDQIASFTETIAKFVATSPDVDVNSVAEAFGRISNLTGTDDFEALASAISQVGVNAAATDQQIIKTTQEIARATSATNLSAAEVVGLAGAFASLGVAPEAARGIFNQFFTQLDKGAAGLNDSLSVAAQIIGTTEEAAKSLYETDSGEFFQQFVNGLAGVENISAALDALGTEGARLGPAFKALAADAERNAAGESVLAKALADANQGFEQRTELARQYAPIEDDLNSRTVLLVNSLRELAYAVGLQLAPALKEGIDGITEIVHQITDFVNTPIGGFVTQAVAALGALTAAYALIRGGIALATASTEALAYATQSLGGNPGIFAGLAGLRTSIAGIGTAASTSTAQVAGLNGALATTGGAATGAAAGTGGLVTNLGRLAKGGGIVGGVLLIGSAITDLRGTVLSLIDTWIYLQENLRFVSDAFNAPIAVLFGFAEALGIVDTTALNTASSAITVADVFSFASNLIARASTVIAFVLDRVSERVSYWGQVFTIISTRVAETFGGVTSSILGNLSGLANALTGFLGPFAKGFSNGLDLLNNGTSTSLASLRELAERLPGAGGAVRDLGNNAGGAGEVFADVTDDTNGLSDSLGGLGDAAEDAAAKVYTLTDYANDLSSVFNRAFDIRFGGEASLDGIANTWQKIKDDAEAAARSVRDLRSSIRELEASNKTLNSDIKILEYYKSIALAYGDTKRAAALDAELAEKRAQLAKNSEDLSDKNADLKKAVDAQSKTTRGNSQAARDNRQTLRDLSSEYTAHIAKLAESGLSQDQLARETAKLKQQFIDQAVQLGFSRKEAERYAVAFDDVAKAIANVPRNITVTANVDPAVQALNEFKARADAANRSLGKLKSSASSGVPSAGLGNLAAGAPQASIRLEALAQAVRLTALAADAIARRDIKSVAIYVPQLAYWRARAVNGFSEGGYTGAGGKYEVKGAVHGGEYVIPKRDVNQATGMPYADALGRLMGGVPSRSTAPATAGGSSSASVVTLSAGSIQALAQAVQPYLVLDGKMVAESSANVYSQQSNVGAY